VRAQLHVEALWRERRDQALRRADPKARDFWLLVMRDLAERWGAVEAETFLEHTVGVAFELTSGVLTVCVPNPARLVALRDPARAAAIDEALTRRAGRASRVVFAALDELAAAPAGATRAGRAARRASA
jgi:hypothetical protein